MTVDFQERVIIALDFIQVEQADFFLSHWRGRRKPFIKIGYALFFAAGPRWIDQRKQEGYSIFLDLKLHDIPQAVAKAVTSIGKMGVDMITLHASGGSHMIEAAREAVECNHHRMKLLAVTQLTSTDQRLLNDYIGIPGTIAQCVVSYAHQAERAGADGVVCSGHEIEPVKKEVSDSFLIVVPGIRWKEISNQDQKRVVTPLDAIRRGADHLVVGRPITQAASPIEIYDEILNELQRGCVV